MNKAVFLDKDGTLIPDIPYNIDTSKITFTTGAFEALHLLQEQDYLLVIVSNQSGIAKGYFTEEAFRQVPLYFIERFLQEGFFKGGDRTAKGYTVGSETLFKSGRKFEETIGLRQLTA